MEKALLLKHHNCVNILSVITYCGLKKRLQPILHAISRILEQNCSAKINCIPIRIHFHLNRNISKDARRWPVYSIFKANC